MGLSSWLRDKFKKETPLQTLQISKIETPEKIVETKITPIRVPTVVYIGGRLALISRDLSELKQEMVSKSWFRTEYEDAGTGILEKLKEIDSKIESLNSLLKELSNVTKCIKPDLIKEPFYEETFNTKGKILEIIINSNKIRFKDLSNRLNISDPTLSKYLKILLSSNKIKRTRIGKAVFYETF
jgi:DNA-binding transcriptional ArsR family regulator